MLFEDQNHRLPVRMEWMTGKVARGINLNSENILLSHGSICTWFVLDSADARAEVLLPIAA